MSNRATYDVSGVSSMTVTDVNSASARKIRATCVLHGMSVSTINIRGPLPHPSLPLLESSSPSSPLSFLLPSHPLHLELGLGSLGPGERCKLPLRPSGTLSPNDILPIGAFWTEKCCWSILSTYLRKNTYFFHVSKAQAPQIHHCFVACKLPKSTLQTNHEYRKST